MQENHYHFFNLGLCIIFGAALLAGFLKVAIQRSGAMQAGLTPEQYSEWVDNI